MPLSHHVLAIYRALGSDLCRLGLLTTEVAGELSLVVNIFIGNGAFLLAGSTSLPDTVRGGFRSHL